MRRPNEFPIFQLKKGAWMSVKFRHGDTAVAAAKRIGAEVLRYEYEERGGSSFGVLKERWKP